MKMTQTVIVEGVSRWNMVDEKTGNPVRGSKIFVENSELLATEDKKGKFPTTFNLDYAAYEQFQQVPGLYELDMTMKVGSKGQFTVAGVRYVGDSKQVTQK